MEYKDYYKILGVEKTATAGEIKKTYRKLAIKYHPDKAPDDKKAEEKFKEINEAYDVIGDPEKRKKYDELGANWQHYQQQGGGRGGAENPDFSQWANAQGGGFRPEDFAGGEGHFSDFFEQMFGGSGGNNFGGGGQRKRAGRDAQAALQISLAEAYHGGPKAISLDGQPLNLKIKPGIADGQILRLKGKGHPGAGGAPQGDLLLTINVAEHPRFERRGDDLYFDQPIDAITAILGGKASVQTITKTISMNIPAETDSGKVFRLKGMGMPLYDHPEQHGDAFVRVLLQSPKHLTPAQQEALRAQFQTQNAAS